MNTSIRIMSLAAPLLFAALANAGDITYTINDGLLSLTGTITTDGNIGSLTQSDIVSWTLTSDFVHDSPNLTLGNSDVMLSGSVLNASLTQLTFDFSSSASGLLIFETPDTFSNPMQNSVATEFCDADTATACDNSVNSSLVLYYVDPGCCSSHDGQAESGVVPIATNLSAPTPEPGSLPTFVGAIGAMGLLSWWSRRERPGSRT